MTEDQRSQRNGFLKCQIQMSEVLLSRHREIYEELKKLRAEINTAPISLDRQHLLNKFLRLSGEADALKWVNDKLSLLSSLESRS